MSEYVDKPMPFGKFNGVLICDVPNSYLKWVVGEKFFNSNPFYKEEYELCMKELKFREQNNVFIKDVPIKPNYR